MKDYIIVRESLIEDFVESVNKKIRMGYVPLGGLLTEPWIGNDNGVPIAYSYYIQAMVKEEIKEADRGTK